MNEKIKLLGEQARELSAQDRITLVEDVLDSLDQADEAIDRLWAKEANDRLAAYRRGELKAKVLVMLFWSSSWLPPIAYRVIPRPGNWWKQAYVAAVSTASLMDSSTQLSGANWWCSPLHICIGSQGIGVIEYGERGCPHSCRVRNLRVGCKRRHE